MVPISKTDLSFMSMGTNLTDRYQQKLQSNVKRPKLDSMSSSSFNQIDRVDLNAKTEFYKTYSPETLQQANSRYIPDTTDAAMRAMQRDQNTIKDLMK